MTRGKNAAQAANRRATEAQEKAALLETALREERAAHQHEIAQLQTTLNALRSQINREARALAEEQVRVTREEAAATVTKINNEYTQRVIRGLDELQQQLPEGIKLTSEGYPAVATAFGIQLRDWMSHLDQSSRAVRRNSNAAFQRTMRIRRNIERQGKHADPEGRAWVESTSI